MRRNSGGAGPRCEETEKGRGRETGAAGREERAGERGSAERMGRGEAGRSAALSPGIAGGRPGPARPRFKRRPGGRGRTPTALSGQTRVQRAKSGLSCRHPALRGARDSCHLPLHLPPPPPPAAPRALRLPVGLPGPPLTGHRGSLGAPHHHLKLWDQHGWASWDKEQACEKRRRAVRGSCRVSRWGPERLCGVVLHPP